MHKNLITIYKRPIPTAEEGGLIIHHVLVIHIELIMHHAMSL